MTLEKGHLIFSLNRHPLALVCSLAKRVSWTDDFSAPSSTLPWWWFWGSLPSGAREGINWEWGSEAKKRSGWLLAETGAVWADSWGWDYCFGSSLSLHEHLPHWLLAAEQICWNRSQAARTRWWGHENSLIRAPPPVMKCDPKWLHLALKWATTTLQELSALWKSVFIGDFLSYGNRQVT